MSRKFGKKKEVNLNPLSYNIGIAGLSGVGKTTLVKNICEQLVGSDGYLMLDIGRESGHDCITDIVSETVDSWEKLEEVVEDIVDNRTTEYADLKVVVFDTLDELFVLAEEEAIRVHNNKNPDKRVDTVNSVAGGFGKGLDACIELVLDKIWSLKEVGLSFIVIMHTKSKDVEDVVSGQTYQVITANMTQRYFNAIKTKLDFLGVAYIDRNIITEKTGRKDIVTKKDITRNKVVSEARRISFRSDDYNLDCKARFSEIASDIPLDADEFIKALTNAILAEQSKSGKTLEQTKADQEKTEAIKLKQIAEKEEKNQKNKELASLVTEVTNYIKENKKDMSKIKPILEKTKELGYENPTVITKIEDIEIILKMIR
jgi:DNA helicase HerA-like ATPase